MSHSQVESVTMRLLDFGAVNIEGCSGDATTVLKIPIQMNGVCTIGRRAPTALTVTRLTALTDDILQIDRTVSGALRARRDVDVGPLIGKGGEDNAVGALTDFRLACSLIYF